MSVVSDSLKFLQDIIRYPLAVYVGEHLAVTIIAISCYYRI